MGNFRIKQKIMYIIVKENQLKVNQLTKNADKIIISIDQNLKMTNYDDLLQSISENKQPIWKHDETFIDVRIKETNLILLVKKFGEHLTNIGCTDFEIRSDLIWNDGGLSDLDVRVTMPQDLILNNPNYRALISHVEGLQAENKAHYYANNGLMYLYFLQLLPEHEALLSADNNVLIETKPAI
jgi:hypothetical protein